MNSLRLGAFISAALNAPMAAAYAFVILVASGDFVNGAAVLSVSVVFATVVQMVTLYFLARMKVTSDFYASRRETRSIPFAIALTSFLCGSLALSLLQAPPQVIALMLSLLVSNGVLALVTLRWKISIHTAGITGPATVLIYSLGGVGYLFLILVIPVAWARTTLKAHTASELLGGALLAILATYALLRIYLPVT